MSELYIYNEIGGYGTTAEDVVDFLKENKDSDIEIYINSPGGNVFQGLAIYEAINRHKGQKKIYIDGLAASIASIIALSGDEVTMGKGAFFMIHNPFSFAMGDEEEMKKENAVKMWITVKDVKL